VRARGDETVDSQAARVVCIMGMPRSGSSMIARIMNLMGLYLGPEDGLILETEYNVTGCWEHRKLLEISDSILRKARLYEGEQPDWVQSPAIAGMAETARTVIEADFSDRELWGWKDERCSLTLPFWDAILPGRIEGVICIRNPMDVARSILKLRWDPSLEAALIRWLIHISSAIGNTRDRRRLIVFYEDLLGENWETAIREVAEFLGPSHVAALPACADEIASFIKKDLRPQSTSLSDLVDDPALPDAVKHLYLMLHDHVRRRREAGAGVSPGDSERVLEKFASSAYAEAMRL